MSQSTFTFARSRLNEWRLRTAVLISTGVTVLFFAGANADYALSLTRERLWDRHEARVEGLAQRCLVMRDGWFGSRMIRTFPGDCAPIQVTFASDFPDADFDLVTKELISLSVPDVAGRTWEVEAEQFAGLPSMLGARLPVLLDPDDLGRIWHLPSHAEMDGFARSLATAAGLFLACLACTSAVLFAGFRNPDREA